MFFGVKRRPAHKADNLTAHCDPIVLTMSDPYVCIDIINVNCEINSDWEKSIDGKYVGMRTGCADNMR
jgi:hypothetical protein